MEGKHPRVSSPSASQPTVTGNLRGLQCGDCGSGPRSSQCLRHPSMFPPGAGLVRGLAQPPNPDNVQLRDRKNRKRIYCPSMLLLSFSSLVFFFFFLPLAASSYPWCGSFSSYTDIPVQCVDPLFLGGVLPRAGL